MKYILTLILFLLFVSCSKNNKTQENIKKEINKTQTYTKQTKQTQKTEASPIITINFKNFKLEFNNTKLIYPENKMILLFDNNNTYSKAEESVLKKLKVKYYKTDSVYLKKYFKIKYFPTIIVLEKNKTVKYENFTPYEILKAEGF